MATRIQQIDFLQSPAFQKQLAGSLLAAAINVGNEDTATANHKERASWARAIVQAPQVQASTMLNYVLSNPTVASAAGGPNTDSGTPVTDSDLDYVVASLYTRFALQFAGVQQ